MTLPINHHNERVRLACEQLRALYPSASGAVLLAAVSNRRFEDVRSEQAKAANSHAIGNVIPFPALDRRSIGVRSAPSGWEFAETIADHGKGEF